MEYGRVTWSWLRVVPWAAINSSAGRSGENDHDAGGNMKTQMIDVPEELLGLLQRSRLGSRASADQVRAALATHPFLEG